MYGITCILVDVWTNLWFYEDAQQSSFLWRTETDLVSSSAFPEQCDVYSVASILARFFAEIFFRGQNSA